MEAYPGFVRMVTSFSSKLNQKSKCRDTDEVLGGQAWLELCCRRLTHSCSAKARFQRTSGGIWMTFPPFVHIVRRWMGIEIIIQKTLNMQENMSITIWKSRGGYFKAILFCLFVSEAPGFPSTPPGREVERRNYICPSCLLLVLTVPLMSPTLQLHLHGVLSIFFSPPLFWCEILCLSVPFCSVNGGAVCHFAFHVKTRA